MSEKPRSRNPDEVPEYTVPAEDLHHFGDTVNEIPDQTTPYYEKPDAHEPGVGESEPSWVKPELDTNTARRIAIIEKYPDDARSTLIGLAHQLNAGSLYNSQALRANMAWLAQLTNQDEAGVRQDFSELAYLLAADEQELTVASPDSFPSDQLPAGQDIITHVPGMSGDTMTPTESADSVPAEVPNSEELAPEPKSDSDRFIDGIRSKLATYPEVLQVLEDAYSNVERLTSENRSNDTITAAENSWREKLKNAGSIYGVPKDPEHNLDRMFNTYMNHRSFAK